MNDWSELTCITFRENSDDKSKNYVKFDNARGCYSYVGMVRNEQTIGLAREWERLN